VSAVPANSDPLAGLPLDYAIADDVDNSSDFVTRDSWILDPRPKALFCK
jgi:hypothetical protein